MSQAEKWLPQTQVFWSKGLFCYRGFFSTSRIALSQKNKTIFFYFFYSRKVPSLFWSIRDPDWISNFFSRKKYWAEILIRGIKTSRAWHTLTNFKILCNFLAEIEKKYLRKREKKLTEILKILEKMLREEKPFKLNRKISFGTRWLHLALAIINFNFLLLLSLTLTHSYLHAHAHTLKHSLAASHFRFDTLTHPLLRATPSRPPTTSWWETKVASLSLSLSLSSLVRSFECKLKWMRRINQNLQPSKSHLSTPSWIGRGPSKTY